MPIYSVRLQRSLIQEVVILDIEAPHRFAAGELAKQVQTTDWHPVDIGAVELVSITEQPEPAHQPFLPFRKDRS